MSWPVLRLSWPVLRLSWPVLGLYWPVLGLSWPVLSKSIEYLSGNYTYDRTSDCKPWILASLSTNTVKITLSLDDDEKYFRMFDYSEKKPMTTVCYLTWEN